MCSRRTQVGAKDGPCILPAAMRGTRRTKEDADQIDVAFLDSDTGVDMAALESAVRQHGWSGVVASTHSHMTTTTRVNRSNWDRWRAKHPNASEAMFLIEDKQYLPHIAANARIMREDGAFVYFEHQPCPKFRVALPLLEPWRAANYLSQDAANAAWAERIETLAATLVLQHDQSCTDTSRLFYLPRRPHDAAPPETVVIDGELCDLFSLPAADAGLFTAKSSSNGAGNGDAHTDNDMHEFVEPVSGEVLDLRDWAREYGHRFLIADALRARKPSVVTGHVANRIKVPCRCPNEDAHTEPGADGATIVINAGEGRNAGFAIHCRHAHCTGLDRLAFVRMMLEQDWLSIPDLTACEFLADRPMPPPNGAAQASEPPPETEAAAFARLAKLPLLEYERARGPEAVRMGLRTPILDRLVAAERGDENGGSNKQGRTLTLPVPDPWPEPVGGAELLDQLATFYTRHILLPAGAADAMAVWTVHTYCFSLFRHSPRLAFTSPERRCGKTTALDTTALVCCKPLPTANVTAAAVFRTIEAASPTLLIDEADTFLRDNEELRGVLNAGHKRGGQVVRCVGDDAEPRAFGVFAPAAIAAIGRLPGTIEDRSILVRMKRATRPERPEPLHTAAETEGAKLASRCARWVADHTDRLREADPALPAGLFNRAADNWRPLFAIAEAAAGDWPERLAKAVVALAPNDADAEGRGVMLLADVRTIFNERKANRDGDKLASADLCVALAADATGPWADYKNGKPIGQGQLARALKPFGLFPGTVRIGDATPKGYQREDFEEAWSRYLPEDGTSAKEGGMEPPHRHNPQETAPLGADCSATEADNVAERNRVKPAWTATCGGVAVEIPPTLAVYAIEGSDGDLGQLPTGRVTAVAVGITGACLSSQVAPACGPADDASNPTRRIGWTVTLSRWPRRDRQPVAAPARMAGCRGPPAGKRAVFPLWRLVSAAWWTEASSRGLAGAAVAALPPPRPVAELLIVATDGGRIA